MDEKTTVLDFAQSLLQTEAERENAKAAKEAERRVVQAGSKKWSDNHRKRAAKLETELLSGADVVGADQRLLVRLAAHEAAHAERLDELHVQLAERMILLVDDPKTSLKLAKTLREVVTVSATTGRRIESLLSTAGVLQAQRNLAPERARLKIA